MCESVSHVIAKREALWRSRLHREARSAVAIQASDLDCRALRGSQ
jgi:hypothetical protein